MKTKSVKRADINIHGGTQQREVINPEVVAEYAEAMKCGVKFPAITLFFDGAQYWLADGFHRYHASKEAEFLDLLCDVHDGTQRDALFYSAGANSAHGLRPTNADKRKSVMVLLTDSVWSEMTDSKISMHCRVTQPFVSKLRKEQAAPKIITVIIPEAKPAPVADVDFSNPPENAELSTGGDENYNPAYHELELIQDALESVVADNDSLRNQLAANQLGGDADEQADILNRLNALTEENRKLEIINHALTKARDGLMVEVGQLKRQLAINAREIKKLKK